MTTTHQRMLSDLLPGERAYPIYRVSIRWQEDIDPSREPPPPRWLEGMPAGRRLNSTNWDTMFREVRELEDIEAEVLRDRWPQCAINCPNASEPDVLATFARWEVWVCDWFSHRTFDVGLDDQAILESFSRFVDRTTEANYRLSGLPDQPYCLMGAEDRWRWHGTVNGSGDERTDPPCRCEYCKKFGLVRINH